MYSILHPVQNLFKTFTSTVENYVYKYYLSATDFFLIIINKNHN